MDTMADNVRRASGACYGLATGWRDIAKIQRQFNDEAVKAGL